MTSRGVRQGNVRLPIDALQSQTPSDPSLRLRMTEQEVVSSLTPFVWVVSEIGDGGARAALEAVVA